MEVEQTMKYTVLPLHVNKPLVNQMFSSDMVFQRDVNAEIWGWTEPGSSISVTVNDQMFTAIGDEDGKWIANIGLYSAGGPYTITIADGKSTNTLTNVMFGDVWLCSGQSNMEFTMSNILNAPEEIQNATNSNIRFITIPNRTSAVPLTTMDESVKWQVASPNNVENLSAVGYFFAKELTQEMDVPIGIVFAAVGGTKAESWTSYNTLKDNPNYSHAAEEIHSGVAIIETTSSPIALYNGMIAPITPYPLKGVLWYQGESNWGEPTYSQLLPELISDWRKSFNNAQLPFVIIQIAAYGALQTEDNPAQSDPGLPEVREAQLYTSLNDNNVGLVVTSDLGDPSDIHPKNKQDVGIRAARNALGEFYNKEIVYSGPIYKSMKLEGDNIRLTFDFTGSGLFAGVKNGLEPVAASPDDKLKGFAIAGADHQYYMAEAVIDGDSVIVSSSYVNEPVSVKYGWNDSPIGNLYNLEGLLTSPFRTGE
ncbi:hypothetical protein LPB68_20910 [Paenibacillus crassostreae]|nr:hypothetical protein LPB68_20910 [Paenibacillus crassostreae]